MIDPHPLEQSWGFTVAPNNFGLLSSIVRGGPDVLTVSPDEVRNTQVLWTMEDGRMVYEAKQ